MGKCSGGSHSSGCGHGGRGSGDGGYKSMQSTRYHVERVNAERARQAERELDPAYQASMAALQANIRKAQAPFNGNLMPPGATGGNIDFRPDGSQHVSVRTDGAGVSYDVNGNVVSKIHGHVYGPEGSRDRLNIPGHDLGYHNDCNHG